MEQYAELVLRTGLIIKKIQPYANVYLQIAGNATYAKVVLQYLQQQGFFFYFLSLLFFFLLLPLGQLDLVDTVTFHPYTYNPDTSYPGEDTAVLNAVRSVSPSISIYQGENGAPNGTSSLHPCL